MNIPRRKQQRTKGAKQSSGGRSSSALSDAYKIHGDGVARMVPERLMDRPTFQDNLSAIENLLDLEKDS